MDNNFNYRELQSGEEEKVCELVMECFNEFVAPGYSKEGIEEFSRYVNPDLLANRLKTADNFVILALDKQKVIGAIEVWSHNHISLLFVNREYHKKGIAKTLIQHAVEKCKQFDLTLSAVDVNSSPYAVDIYTKMGFAQTDIEQVKNGIRFIPMKLKLSNSNVKINSIIGGLELLPLIKPLWEGLREHHSNISKDFSESIRTRNFEDREGDFKGKAGNSIFRIELIKVNDSQYPIGYSISSLNNGLGELESIFIEKAYRGLHIGDLLIKNALKWMDEHNAKTKRISVMAGNDVMGFYEKYGFKVRSHILEQVD